MDTPRILVTNDDGAFAPGIKALVDVARSFGEVIVVAPDAPQSGMGHAITIEHPIRLHRIDGFGDIEAYECTGTPVDCVKLAKHALLKDRPIDLCLSGINHGSNASINIIYSGTMSAAMEASIEGVPSIGFSLMDFSFDADFEPCKPYLRHIIRQVLSKGINGSNLLNVNIPVVKDGDIKGIKVCHQARGRWSEEFVEGTDPRGQRYYWMTGQYHLEDHHPASDIHALRDGYISVVPSQHDLTAHDALPELDHLTNFDR